MEQIQAEVMSILVNVLLALIGLASAYATLHITKMSAKVRAETKFIEDGAKHALVDSALRRLEDVAYKTVNKLEQTAAKTIRQGMSYRIAEESMQDQLKELASYAAVEIKRTLGPEYVQCLKEGLGDFDTYLKNVIEDQLVKIKRGAANE